MEGPQGTVALADGLSGYVVGIAVDNQGFVYVTDTGHGKVQKFTSDGEYVLSWSRPGLRGIAVSLTGEVYVYVSYIYNDWHAVNKFTSNGDFVSSWGTNGGGSAPGDLNEPSQLAVDSSGHVYVADHRKHRIQRFDSEGNYISHWGGQGQGDGEFNYPHAVAVDTSGYVYAGQYRYGNRVQRFKRGLPIGSLVTKITDAAERETSLAYDGSKRLTSITTPMGTVSFTYDSYGNLESSADLAGATTSYGYDHSNHYITAITTPKGTTDIAYCWDTNVGWHLISITDAEGNIRRYGYYGTTDEQPCCPIWPNEDPECDPNYSKVFVRDALDHTTWYETNLDGFTISIEDPIPASPPTIFDYDQDGNRDTITNANGDTFTLTYDDRGNILTITEPDPLNHTTSFTYDTRDNLTHVTDALDRTYEFTYDADDNLLSIENPLEQETTFTYDSLGQLETMTNARGKVFTFTHDAYGNVSSVQGPLSWQVNYENDDMGRVTSITDPRSNTTTLERDLLGRLTKIIHPDLSEVTVGRDCCNVTSITDENGRTTGYQYDLINRLTRVTDARLGETDFVYDAASRLTSLTDAIEQVTGFGYDDADRLVGMTYPELTSETYTPDGVGRIINRVDGKQVSIDYAYDPMGRLTGINEPVSGLDIDYAYDAVGNLDIMTDPTGTTDFDYDALNRLETVTYQDIPNDPTVGYTYDEVGNLKTITTSFGTVTYNYDDLNRLASLTLPNLQEVSYQYDNAGNLTRADYPNGTYSTLSYDNRNRLISLSNEKTGEVVISQYAYTLDGVGNRTDVSYQEPLSRAFSFGSPDYTYDPGNLLTSANGTSYEYDDNGNLIRRIRGQDETTYTYDALNRLTMVSSPSGTVEYQYDGLGNRVAKIIGGGTTVRYVVDPNGPLPQVLAEMDAQGNITSYYVYDAFGLVAKIVGSDVYYYHFDGLGSTIAMTDSNGDIVNKYAYDAFGNLMAVEETVPNAFRYIGRYGVMHEDTGLLYMRARYYDPEVGRFTAKDPIGYAGGINLHTYVGNNPSSLVDPLGLLPLPDYIAATLTWSVPRTRGFAGISVVVEIDRQGNPYIGVGPSFGRSLGRWGWSIVGGWFRSFFDRFGDDCAREIAKDHVDENMERFLSGWSTSWMAAYGLAYGLNIPHVEEHIVADEVGLGSKQIGVAFIHSWKLPFHVPIPDW